MIELSKYGEHPRKTFICDNCGKPLHDHIMDMISPPLCPNQKEIKHEDKTRYYKKSTTTTSP